MDCLYVAWSHAAERAGVKPKRGSRTIFLALWALLTSRNPNGVYIGIAPFIVNALCRMNGLQSRAFVADWITKEHLIAGSGNALQSLVVKRTDYVSGLASPPAIYCTWRHAKFCETVPEAIDILMSIEVWYENTRRKGNRLFMQ